MDTELIKHIKDVPFVMIPNSLARAECNNLSPAARGILVDLLSRPPGWRINASFIKKNNGLGKYKFTQITAELKKEGYLKIENIQDEHTGIFIGRKWHVYVSSQLETPQGGSTEGRIIGPADGQPINNNVVNKNTVVPSVMTEVITEDEVLPIGNSPSSASITPVIQTRISTFDYPEDSDEYALGSHIIDCVEESRNTYARYLTTPEGREAVIQNQAHVIHLMITKDDHKATDILKMFDLVQESPFWKGNILSAYKLRIQWDRLWSELAGAGSSFPVSDPTPKLTQELVEAYRSLINNPKFKPNYAQTQKFIEGSKRVKEFYQDTGINPNNWVRYLINCLEKTYVDGKSTTIYPGMFCSDNTWGILMPQYMQEIGLI